MSDEQNKKIKWKYCPGCGYKLPEVENLKFCIKCGLDLNYIVEHKALPPNQNVNIQQNIPYYSSNQEIYKPKISIPDAEVFQTKERLWGNLPSLGLPLLAFILMNGIVLGILILLIIILPDINLLIAIVSNPYFIVFSTLAELILIILPLWYVKKYLQNPSLENRLTLLGFSTKGYDRKGVLKEIGIGIGFAFIGILLVIGASFLIRIILESLGIIIVEESPTSDADALISGFDILVLVLMLLMMILIVGPCEEILFRGFMQRGLVRTLGDKWGIFITALIFAMIHLVSLIFYILDPVVFLILFIYLLVPYMAISLMLGFLFKWRRENLIAVIVAHGVYNSITLIIAFLFMAFY